MNRYSLSIAFIFIVWCGGATAQSSEDVQKAKAYHAYLEIFSKAKESDTALLNILGQIYRELPVTTAKDQEAKKKLAENFQEKFHLSIDNFPLRLAGFFSKDKYEDILAKILKENLESVPAVIQQAETVASKHSKDSQTIIDNAFISLLDAFYTYKSLANAQENLLAQGRKQLNALQLKYPALAKLEDAIKQKFNQTYIYDDKHKRNTFIEHTVGELGGYILEQYSELTSNIERGDYTSEIPTRLRFKNDAVNPILGLSGILRLAFWLMQYEALKKPLDPKLDMFNQRLNDEAIPLVDFYQASISRQEYRDLLEVAEKTLAQRIKSIIQNEESFCIKNECFSLKPALEHLIYYLVRYASLQTPLNTSLVQKALEHIKQLISKPNQVMLHATLVPFVNSWDELMVKLQDDARRHTPS